MVTARFVFWRLGHRAVQDIVRPDPPSAGGKRRDMADGGVVVPVGDNYGVHARHEHHHVLPGLGISTVLISTTLVLVFSISISTAPVLD